jgi:PAS domain S-box-containing protein
VLVNQTTDDPDKANGAAPPPGSTTILVVDDDPDVLWSTSRILRDAGFLVLEGAGAADAIKLTQEYCPALVLLDVELPDGNGVNVALQIKKDPALFSVFVVLCSGKRISQGDQVEGLMRGLADGYIIRPVGKDELLARIDAFLRIRSTLETLRQTNRELFRLRNNAEKQSVELQRANDQLQTEILERKAAEEEARRARDFYLKVLDDFPNPIWRADIHAKCDYFNKDWLVFTGRSIEQELGDGWVEGVHPDDLDRCIKIFLDNFHAQKPFEMEYRLRYHDGTYRWLYDCGKPFFTLDGEFAGYIGSCYDIHDRRRAEEEIRLLNVDLEKRVTQRTADLQEALTRIEKSLHEKEVMLREIHHRVKNNLQIIISLLNLQSRQFADPQIGDALRESQNRVRAISMVHERLFISNDIEKIDISSYIRSLAANLFSFYKIPAGKMQLSVVMENLTTTIDTAVPLGLVINELLANAIRHAFPVEMSGEITITGKDTGGIMEIRVTDNGVGMTPVVDPDEVKTLGLKLVHILIEQLNGTVEYTPPPGTTVVLRIPKKEG